MNFISGCCLFFLITSTLHAQVYKNQEGALEKHFVYEVKQVDEFFERFNDDPHSFIRQIYKSYDRKFNISRTQLVESLFNYETKSWNDKITDEFIASVTNTQKPLKLNFYDDDWFAEAVCRFQYNSSEIEIPIILRIVTDQNKGSKWVIAGVKPNAIKEDLTPIPDNSFNSTVFIQPASHSNNFIALEKALSDHDNLRAYFDKNFFLGRNSLTFYNAIFNHNARILFVKNIRYHFLQIQNYVFSVEHFERDTKNSGWLINSLQQISEAEKIKYINNLLGQPN